jgi:triacylglycerol lipase
MKTVLLVLALPLLVALGSFSGLAVAGSASAVSGPVLQVSEEAMASALSCPTSFSSIHEPVLLIHGLTGTHESYWSWTYGKVLPAQGFDVCLVNLPDRARADIQVSAEYVVYAIRTMAARSQSKVDVVAFAGGSQQPRWALKWWPDTRGLVDDLVLMAGLNHGFTSARLICARSCIPALWQLRPDSRFLAVLNAGEETPGGVSYTSVYSRTDQFIWSADGKASDPWTASSRLDGGTTIAVQDICPGRPVEHVQVFYDAAVYAVVIDALGHQGPADPGRINRAACLQGAMPDVDAREAAERTVEIYRDLVILMNEHHTDGEPPPAPYVAS